VYIRLIIYNILIILFLSAAVFFPVFFLGQGIIADLWKTVWPFGILVILTLVLMNWFFLSNGRLFALLQKEDWPALTAYLEQRIYTKRRFTRQNVKLLAQSYLLQGNFGEIIQFERRIAAAKPFLAEENVLIFGAARLLGDAAASQYFKSLLDRKPPSEYAEWIRWYYGFSLVFTGADEKVRFDKSRFEEALNVFGELAKEAKDSVISGLCAYVLCRTLGNNFPADSELYTAAAEGKNRVLKTVKTLKKWQKRTKKLTEEVHGVIINKYLDEAGAWIFGATKIETAE